MRNAAMQMATWKRISWGLVAVARWEQSASQMVGSICISAERYMEASSGICRATESGSESWPFAVDSVSPWLEASRAGLRVGGCWRNVLESVHSFTQDPLRWRKEHGLVRGNITEKVREDITAASAMSWMEVCS